MIEKIKQAIKKINSLDINDISKRGAISALDLVVNELEQTENMKKQFNFGTAIEAAKQGKRVAREGWNGKGMFIFQRPADELSLEMVVHKVKSLPQSVKDFFAQKNEQGLDGSALIRFGAYLCMYAADGSIVNGWLASQTDILAEDWVILD